MLRNWSTKFITTIEAFRISESDMSSFKKLTCPALIDLLNLSVQDLIIESALSIAITLDLPSKTFNKEEVEAPREQPKS